MDRSIEWIRSLLACMQCLLEINEQDCGGQGAWEQRDDDDDDDMKRIERGPGAGEQFSLICTRDASHPAVTLTWEQNRPDCMLLLPWPYVQLARHAYSMSSREQVDPCIHGDGSKRHGEREEAAQPRPAGCGFRGQKGDWLLFSSRAPKTTRRRARRSC